VIGSMHVVPAQGGSPDQRPHTSTDAGGLFVGSPLPILVERCNGHGASGDAHEREARPLPRGRPDLSRDGSERGRPRTADAPTRPDHRSDPSSARCCFDRTQGSFEAQTLPMHGTVEVDA
jgi:hypothetical protein